MLFKKLAGLLAGNTAVTLLVTGKEEAMTVTVIPKPEKATEETAALSTPLTLTGSAAELDEGFCELLEKFAGARKSLAEQFEATAAVLEAAKKEAAEKAAKGVAKTAKAATTKPAPKSVGAPKAAEQAPQGDDGENDGNGATPVIPPGQAATEPSSNLFA